MRQRGFKRKKVYTIVIKKKRKKMYFARMWNQAEISIKQIVSDLVRNMWCSKG